MELLESKNVNIRGAGKKDIPLLADWLNDIRFIGEYSDLRTQTTMVQLERLMFEPKFPQMEWVDFIIKSSLNYLGNLVSGTAMSKEADIVG